MSPGRYVTAARLWRLKRRYDVAIGPGCRISGSAKFFAGDTGRIRIGAGVVVTKVNRPYSVKMVASARQVEKHP